MISDVLRAQVYVQVTYNSVQYTCWIVVHPAPRAVSALTSDTEDSAHIKW